MEVWWTVLLSIVAGAIGIYYYVCTSLNFFEKRGVPYVKPTFLLGNLGNGLLRKISMAENVQKLYRAEPDARYMGIYEFTKPIVMIRDPELIKSVTIKNFENFHDHRQFVDEVLDPIFASNVFALRGERWRQVRNLLTPAFTSSKMKVMFKLVSECGKYLANHLAEISVEPTELELKDVFTRYTNDVIATAGFGISVNSLKDRNNEFYKTGKDAATFGGSKTLKMFLSNNLPKIARLFNVKLFHDGISRFFTDIVKSTIATRDAEGIVRPDMIQLMMQTRGENEKVHLSIDEMTSQVFIFFVAGFETSATTMCFAAYLIATHPAVQKKLCDEIDSVLAECQDDEPTYEALHGMQYLDALVNEALRLYPPVGMLNRMCTKSFALPPAAPGYKSHVVEAGQEVWIPIYGIQRDSQYFERPDEFDPERFTENDKHEINPLTYAPFGLGPRACIGNRFALMETKLALFHLFSKCKLSPSSKTPIPMKLDRESFALTSANGFWLRIEKRK